MPIFSEAASSRELKSCFPPLAACLPQCEPFCDHLGGLHCRIMLRGRKYVFHLIFECEKSQR